MNAKRWLVTAPALAAVGILSSGLSLAANGEEPVPQVTVRYGDLDLRTYNGAARLLQRIHDAARQVCPDTDRDMRLAALVQQCRAIAVKRAVEDVHNVRLTALHATKSGDG